MLNFTFEIFIEQDGDEYIATSPNLVWENVDTGDIEEEEIFAPSSHTAVAKLLRKIATALTPDYISPTKVNNYTIGADVSEVNNLITSLAKGPQDDDRCGYPVASIRGERSCDVPKESHYKVSHPYTSRAKWADVSDG